jgi:hypothetical protein
MKKSINVGFIDVLTGFLCASIFLMILISPGIHPNDDIAGTPREFIHYRVDLNILPTGSLGGDTRTSTKLDSMKLQFILKIGKEIRYVKINKFNSNLMMRDDQFFDWSEADSIIRLYAWGPAKTLDSGSVEKISYHLYGVSEIDLSDSISELQAGVFYYDYTGIEDLSGGSGGLTVPLVANDLIKVSHSLYYLNAGTVNSPNSNLLPHYFSEDTIQMGDYSFLGKN